MGQLVVQYLRSILHEARYLAVKRLSEIIELVALTDSHADLGMDVILEGLEPCSIRLLLVTPRKTEYLLRNLTGIALDHIEKASDQIKANNMATKYPWKSELALLESEKGLLLKCSLRIDAPKTTKFQLSQPVVTFLSLILEIHCLLHAFSDIGDHQATQLIDLVDHVSLVVVFFHMELLPVKARLVQARLELAQSKWDQYRYGAPEVHWQAVAQLVQVDHHLHAPRLHADGSRPVGQAQQGDAGLQVECVDRSNRSPDIHCLSDRSDRKPVASAP
jgi:hypothetical protein